MRTLFGNYGITDWDICKDEPQINLGKYLGENQIDVENLYPKIFDVQTYNPYLHKNPIFEQFKRDVEEKNMTLNIEEIILECSHNEMPTYKFSGWCKENPLMDFVRTNIQPVKRKDVGLPKIKDVKFNGPATIIFWADDTKTIVKAQDEEFDPEKGIAMAIARKALGNKHDYFNVIAKYSKKYYKAKKNEAAEITIELEGGILEDLTKNLKEAFCPQNMEFKFKVKEID